MKKINFILLILIFLSCDKKVTINNIDEFNSYLEEELINQEIPALAVLIYEGETIRYERYLGQSDIENNLELTQDDIFLMASVSKMVTGVALLQLYENGEFDLDENINDYLPFNITIPNQTVPITFRMLLTHTSSIEDGPNAELFYSYGEDSPLALKTYMEKYLLPNGEYYDESDNFYNYEPGTGYNYSNMASALIGVLVEEVTDENFRDYCRENIFQPLGMNDTYWSLNEALLSNKTLVNPYNEDVEAIEHYSFPDYPNGALRSTARDMMRILSALGQNGTFNNHQLLNENTVSEMLSIQIPSLDETMGLHAFLLDDENNIWGHNGSEQGVSSEVGFNKVNKVGVIVLSNSQDVDVSSILLEAYKIGVEL
jgi:CubicO group peptidase (beta-lactamase class C family)